MNIDSQHRLRNLFDPKHDQTCVEDASLLHANQHPFLEWVTNAQGLAVLHARCDIPAFRRLVIESCWLAVRVAPDDLTIRRVMPRATTTCVLPTFQLLHEWLVTQRHTLVKLRQILELGDDVAAFVATEIELSDCESIRVMMMAHGIDATSYDQRLLMVTHRQMRPLLWPVKTPICDGHLGWALYASRTWQSLAMTSNKGAPNCFVTLNVLNDCKLQIYSGAKRIPAGTPLQLEEVPEPVCQGADMSQLERLWDIRSQLDSAGMRQLLLQMSSSLLEVKQAPCCNSGAEQPPPRTLLGIDTAMERLARHLFPMRKKKDAQAATQKAVLRWFSETTEKLVTGAPQAKSPTVRFEHWRDLLLFFCVQQLVTPRASLDPNWLFSVGKAWIVAFPDSQRILNPAEAAIVARDAAEGFDDDGSKSSPYGLIIGSLQTEAHYNNTKQDRQWYQQISKGLHHSISGRLH